MTRDDDGELVISEETGGPIPLKIITVFLVKDDEEERWRVDLFSTIQQNWPHIAVGGEGADGGEG